MVKDIDKLEWQSEVLTKNVTPLLKDAIDMHYHGYPELSLKVGARLDDAGMLKMASDYGMRGVVIKSQMWPSTGRVYHLRQRVPEIECFASIVLNSVVGGLSPWVVEAAASQGAKVVWLPTWSSTHKIGKSRFTERMQVWWPLMTIGAALPCVDSAGNVLPEVRSIMKLANDLDLVLCTGHLSPADSLAIAREAERMNFTRLIFTHPLSGSVGATLEEMKEMANRGAYVELCGLNIFYGNELKKSFEVIEEVGAERCILSTDAFMEWLPPGPEFFRMFVGRLFLAGIDEESIRTMVRDNPSTLLGLEPVSNQFHAESIQDRPL